MTFDFIVMKRFALNGSDPSGTFRLSMVSGQLFTIVIASLKNVFKESNCDTCYNIREDKILLTVIISASCWKVGSYLPMPGGLQCSMHWFPPPVNYLLQYDPGC